jgi:hypothetical protein
LLELAPRVANVEVAHGQLTNAVVGTERWVVAAFHGQFLGLSPDHRAGVESPAPDRTAAGGMASMVAERQVRSACSILR